MHLNVDNLLSLRNIFFVFSCLLGCFPVSFLGGMLISGPPEGETFSFSFEVGACQWYIMSETNKVGGTRWGEGKGRNRTAWQQFQNMPIFYTP